MLESIEQVQAAVDLESEMPAATGTVEDETFLGYEISQLWDIHTSYQNSIKLENEKFRAIRGDLGKLLFQLKQVLARPGRNGGWSAFLKERKIPRATADRLVIRYQQSLNPKPHCVTEAASEPSEVTKLFNSILLLGRVLATSRQSLYRFIDLLTSSCDDTCRRVTDEGILVLKVAQHLAMAEPPAGGPETEPQSVLARPVIGLDSDLM